MSTFEFSHLPEVERRELCLGLLAEFGVTRIKKTDKGELIHSCCLPDQAHKNGDKNASASLNWKKLTYNCFGCGSSGGLLWFIARCRHLDGDMAREWLGKQTGLGQSVMDLSKLIELLTQIYARPDGKAPIPNYAPSVLDPWTEWDCPHPYLTEKGLIPGTNIYGREVPLSTIEHFRVGYADDYFDGSERIIIPLFWRGKLVGWQARALDPTLPDKYRNSPDFPRDQVLYNYNQVPERAVVVESPLSVLRHFHHVPEMTATFGAKVADEQVMRLHTHENVVLWFDNDKAGWEATHRVGKALGRYCRVWAVDSPYAADPADMDDETVRTLLADRVLPYSIWAPPERLIKWNRR